MTIFEEILLNIRLIAVWDEPKNKIFVAAKPYDGWKFKNI